MSFMRNISRNVRQFGQKLTGDNINSLGQKALHGARVIGRKVSNSISRIEDVANAALPIATKIATMAGYPELGALTSVGNGVKRLVQTRQNIDHVRKMLNDQ